MIRHKIIERARHKRAAIVSHPRSGLSWMRNMLWEFYQLTEEVPETWTEPKHPYIPYFHDGVGMATTQKNNAAAGILARGKIHRREWADKFDGLSFLCRHPLDIMVSNWTRLRLHKKYRKCSLMTFMRDNNIGLRVLLEWWNWWDITFTFLRVEDVEVFVIPYEETLERPSISLAKVLATTRMSDIPLEPLEEAVERSAFKKMKIREKREGFIFADQSEFDRDRPETMSVREGRAGGWRESMSEEERAFGLRSMDRYMREGGTFWKLYREGPPL